MTTDYTNIESHLWECQLSEPREIERKGEIILMPARYANRTVHVIAPTLERAIEMAREVCRPDAVFHQVMKRNAMGKVLVDESVIDAIIGTES